MRSSIILLAAFVTAFTLVATPASAQLKKVRLSATSVAVTELQFRIALTKGFYRDEGLDVEIILIRGAVGMQAFQAREIAFALGLRPSQIQSAVNALMGCYRAFEELDATITRLAELATTA